MTGAGQAAFGRPRVPDDADRGLSGCCGGQQGQRLHFDMRSSAEADVGVTRAAGLTPSTAATAAARAVYGIYVVAIGSSWPASPAC
jgi:hypothetical protein